MVKLRCKMSDGDVITLIKVPLGRDPNGRRSAFVGQARKAPACSGRK